MIHKLLRSDLGELNVGVTSPHLDRVFNFLPLVSEAVPHGIRQQAQAIYDSFQPCLGRDAGRLTIGRQLNRVRREERGRNEVNRSNVYQWTTHFSQLSEGTGRCKRPAALAATVSPFHTGPVMFSNIYAVVSS